MKRSWKRKSGCRLTLIFVLVLATAPLALSLSGAEEPAGRTSGQTVRKALPAAAPAHPAGALAPRPPAAVTQPVPGPHPPATVPAQAASKPPAAKPVFVTTLTPAAAQKGTQAPAAVIRLSLPLAGDLARKPSREAKETPEQLSAIVKKTSELLAAPKFDFLPDRALDPFVPFVSLQPTNGSGGPGARDPLTPLQKMTLAEMERGLKAIAWGGLGRMAVIEDSTGKGFIVGVGTPAGPNDGVITQVQVDSLVIEQQIWNTRTRQRVPEDFTVKMVKKDEAGL